MHRRSLVPFALLAACSLEADDADLDLELDSSAAALSAAAERTRVEVIRDVAGGAGLTAAALMAGIAQSETNLAHCWSEATWACKGPASPSCGGGPVIAGSGDGACSLKRGGLGLFQFDGGTHSQTLARDGEEILLLEGNVSHAVDFVADLLAQDVAGVADRAEAITWMNSIPMRAGDPKLERWAQVVACRYNGCCANTSTCRTRRKKYRDNAISLFKKYGEAFWSGADDCEALAEEGGTIDDTNGCFRTAGPSATWRKVTTGFDNSSQWTMATDQASGANIGTWNLELIRGGRYRIDVHLDGGVHGQSRQAAYAIHAAGRDQEIVFDQAVGGAGFAVLGEVDFATGGGQSIQLADNTGEPGSATVELLFDAVRLTRTGDGDLPADSLGDPRADLGGCSAGGRGAGGLVLSVFVALAALAFRMGRRGG